MPISKINQDGTVDIYNKITGEVKTNLSPDSLGTISPNLVAEYQGMQTPQKQVERVKAETELKKIQTDPESLTMSAEEKKQKTKYSNVEQSTRMLEKNLSEVEATGPLSRPLQMLSSITSGAIMPEAADYESLRKSLIGPLARTISGEVGVLTDKDINRAEGLLPKITDSKQLRENKLYNLKALIAEKQEKEIPTTQPAEPPQQQKGLSGPSGMMLSAGKALTDFLIPETKKIPEKMAKEEQRKQERLQTRGSSKGDLGKSVQYALEDTLGLAKTAIPAGVELGLTIGGPGLAKFGTSKIAGGIGNVMSKLFKPKYAKDVLEEGLNLAKKGGSVREAAIKTAQEAGKKIEGNKIYTDLIKWGQQAKRANLKSSEISAIDDVLANAKRFKGKTFTPETVKKIWDTAESGYSTAGKAGDTITSEYNLALRNTARSLLEKATGGFEAGTKMIKQGIEKEKVLKTIRTALEKEGIKSGLKSPGGELLKSVGKGAAGTAVGGVALYALAKMLGIGSSQ